MEAQYGCLEGCAMFRQKEAVLAGVAILIAYLDLE